MKQFISLLATLLTVLVTPELGNAQIGKEFQNLEPKGPVQQIQYTTTYALFDADKIKSGPESSTVTAWVENGRIQKLETDYSPYFNTKNITIFDWEGNQLTRVQERTQEKNSNSKLDQEYRPYYDQNGKIIVETIISDTKKLLSTLRYHYSTSAMGNEVLEMTMYKPEELEPQGYYYLESDQWGEVLRIESTGQDTGIYFKRVASEGDSIFTVLQVTNSRMQRGVKDTFETVTLQRYDEYGNVTFSEARSHQLNKSASQEEFRVTTHLKYIYEGQQPIVADAKPESFSGKWNSSGYNIHLNLGDSGGPNQGIYSIETLREKDPEIVEEGSDWIFRLRESSIGEWRYDQESQMMYFEQNGHLIAKVKATSVFNRLQLQPEQEHAAALLLRKE